MDTDLIASARELARRPNPITSGAPWLPVETAVCLLICIYADPSQLGGTKRRADGTLSQDRVVLAASAALGRTANSVVLRIMNLRSVLTGGERGMNRVSKLDRAVVAAYVHRLDSLVGLVQYVSATVAGIHTVLQALVPNSSARAVGEDTAESDEAATGSDVQRLRSERRGQGLFRTRVLTNYAFGCAFCGLTSQKPTQNSFLLIASHIRPWRDSTPHDRVDPGNGLSLCAIHDRAFDWGFLTVDDTDSDAPRIVASDHARDHYGPPERVDAEILDLHGRSLIHPEAHFQPPRTDHLRHHRENVFERRFRAG